MEEEKRPGRWFYALLLIGVGLALVLFEIFLNWLLPGTGI